MVLQMLTRLGRRMDEHNEKFNKEVANMRKYQTEVKELKDTITELKNTLIGFNSRLEVVEQISEQEDKTRLTQTKQQKLKKKFQK